MSANFIKDLAQQLDSGVLKDHNQCFYSFYNILYTSRNIKYSNIQKGILFSSIMILSRIFIGTQKISYYYKHYYTQVGTYINSVVYSYRLDLNNFKINIYLLLFFYPFYFNSKLFITWYIIAWYSKYKQANKNYNP